MDLIDRRDTIVPDARFGRTSRSQAVAEYLKGQILSGRWEAGEKVEDMMIASELGVSRNSVREAFGQLVFIRILEKRQWHGYYIPSISIKDVEETITIRENLEVLALDLFMTRRRPEILEEIAASIRRSEGDYKHGDIDAFHKSDYRIHELIHRNCGNSWIPMLISQTRFHIDVMRRMDKKTDFEKVAEDSVASHWRMWDAMNRGERETALSEMKSQIDRHRERLIESLRHESKSAERGKEAPME